MTLNNMKIIMTKLSDEEKKIKDRLARLRSMMRRAWSRDLERYAVLNEAKRPYEGPNKRQKVEYKCASCENYFKSCDVSVDHREPVGSFTLETFGEWVSRLFCFREKLDVLCNKCHNIKSSKENSDRRDKKKKMQKSSNSVKKQPRLRRRNNG